MVMGYWHLINTNKDTTQKYYLLEKLEMISKDTRRGIEEVTGVILSITIVQGPALLSGIIWPHFCWHKSSEENHRTIMTVVGCLINHKEKVIMTIAVLLTTKTALSFAIQTASTMTAPCPGYTNFYR